MPTSEADSRTLVREFHRRILTEKDLDAVDELLTEDYVEHNNALPDGEMRGRESIKQFWEGFFEAFPDLSVTEEFTVAEDNLVVTRHRGGGTHEGEFMGIPSSGNEFEINGIDIFRIEDGRIAEAWVSLDSLGMMQQLGLVPEDATPEAE